MITLDLALPTLQFERRTGKYRETIEVYEWAGVESAPDVYHVNTCIEVKKPQKGNTSHGGCKAA